MRSVIASGIVTEDVLVSYWPNFFLSQNPLLKSTRSSLPLVSKVARILKISLLWDALSKLSCKFTVVVLSGFASVGIYGGSDCLQAVNLPSPVS